MNFTRSVIRNCGTITVNGKTYENISGVMTITDEGIYVDGKPIEEYKEPFKVELTIIGNVQEVSTENSSIKIEGEVHSAVSKNGNISIKGNVLGNAECKNGNIVVAGDIHGDATTKNGTIM